MADSIIDLQRDLGGRLRQLRLARNLDQRTTAEKAGISRRALGMLENGQGSTTETFLRALRALGHTERIAMLAPEPTVSPLALLRTSKPPRRVRRPRNKAANKKEAGVREADIGD